MTELLSYVGERVRLHIHPFQIEETGVLGLRDQWLTISTLPGFLFPIAGMTAYVRGQRPDDEPIDMADLSLADSERLVEIWRA